MRTPSPWTLGKNRKTNCPILAPGKFVHGQGEQLTVMVKVFGDKEIRLANAKLIVAAPDLLEICIKCHKMGGIFPFEWQELEDALRKVGEIE